MILSLSPTFLPCLLHVFLLSVPCRRQEWNDIHHRGNLAGNFHWLIPSVLKEDQFELVFHLAPGFSMPAPIISRFDWVIPADCSALPLPYRNSCGIRHQSPIKADLPFNYTTFSNQPPRTELFLPASALLQFPTDSIPIVSLMNPNLLHIGLRRGLLTQIKSERSEHRITSSCSSVNTHTHTRWRHQYWSGNRERESPSGSDLRMASTLPLLPRISFEGWRISFDSAVLRKNEAPVFRNETPRPLPGNQSQGHFPESPPPPSPPPTKFQEFPPPINRQENWKTEHNDKRRWVNISISVFIFLKCFVVVFESDSRRSAV